MSSGSTRPFISRVKSGAVLVVAPPIHEILRFSRSGRTEGDLLGEHRIGLETASKKNILQYLFNTKVEM